MRSGEKTIPEVEKFIIETKHELPNLSFSKIADRVFDKYHYKIDKGTVRNVIKRNPPTSSNYSSASPYGISPELRRHFDELKSPLLDLLGIAPLGAHDYDLAVWYSHTNDPCWPVPGGQICKGYEGEKLRFRLDVEEKLEWSYLRQHLQGDELWDDIELLKREAASDIEGRLGLFRAIIGEIERPEDEGGLGFSVDLEMKYDGSNRSAVGLAYAFALYDQVLSRSLKLSHGPLSEGAFALISGMKRTNTLHLANGPAIFAPDEIQRMQAITFIIKGQETMVQLPEANAAAEGYRLAETRVENVKRHIQRLRLVLGFPLGSECDGCENWVN